MNIGVIIVVAIAGLWALGIFLGVIGGFSKTFTHTPAGLDSSSIKSQAQESTEQTKEKEQKLMDDMKQKMQDAGQKY
jgi:hypothetical protein